MYFIAVALTAGVFISERKEGLLDRSLVAGTLLWISFYINSDFYHEWIDFCRR